MTGCYPPSATCIGIATSVTRPAVHLHRALAYTGGGHPGLLVTAALLLLALGMACWMLARMRPR